MGLFLIGGLTGLFLGAMGLVVHLTDTYFVVAHFHYVMVGGQVIAYLGGIHYWWPKMTGKMYSEFWGKISAMLVFIGFNLTFFPQFILGYQGMPRRYASYPEELQVLNIFSTAGASVLGVGLAMPVVYLDAFADLRASRRATIRGCCRASNGEQARRRRPRISRKCRSSHGKHTSLAKRAGLDLEEARRRDLATVR